jgi:hypothetical protein
MELLVSNLEIQDPAFVSLEKVLASCAVLEFGWVLSELSAAGLALRRSIALL